MAPISLRTRGDPGGPEGPRARGPGSPPTSGSCDNWGSLELELHAFLPAEPPPDTFSNPRTEIFTLLHMLPPHFSSQETRRIPNPNKSNAKLRLQPVFQLTEPSFSVQFSSSIPRNFAEKLENFQCAEFSQFLSEETLNCSPQFQPNFCPSIEPT